jgi:multidrug resistance efflux pump
MSSATASPALPARRLDLVIKHVGDGRSVVKDPRAQTYFELGAEESFLLDQLDGRRGAAEVQAAFEDRFTTPLAAEDLDAFLEMVEQQKLLDLPAAAGPLPSPTPAVARPGVPDHAGRGNLLYWRKAVLDPDRLLTWLAPRLAFCWTTPAFAVSLLCIIAATGVLWANRADVADGLGDVLRWETAAVVWLTVMTVATLHEFAHGLTCKHFGGEVHEMGVLFMFFMPCLYCNVSDAWLMPERSRRLWITFAGGYFQLFLWSLSVFVWRVTLPGTHVNFLAFVVLSTCGVQTLVNFNPLMKLDGYYLLSDWWGIPNLQQRSAAYLTADVRHWLWGGPRPQADDDAGRLLFYGFVSLLYQVAFLAIILVGTARVQSSPFGSAGLAAGTVLVGLSARRLFRGFSAGEVSTMIRTRPRRTGAWALAAIAVASIAMVPFPDGTSGPFLVRTASRVEVCAQVGGFLREVCVEEGHQVEPGQVLARLEVPDLETRVAQKRAEVAEARAQLRILTKGARPEELRKQRERVQRARRWADQGRLDLDRARRVDAAKLDSIEKLIAQHQAELEHATARLGRGQRLADRLQISQDELGDLTLKAEVFRRQGEQVQAQKAAHLAQGILEAETELGRREHELADQTAALALLEAGPRPEEVEAQEARLARLLEEVRHLDGLRERLLVRSPGPGQVTTTRLREQVGHFYREGDPILVVQELDRLEAEISIAEQDVRKVQPGQPVTLKARLLPFQTLATTVDRIAVTASHGDTQSTITVVCRLTSPSAQRLSPGMSGHARIRRGSATIGKILVERALALLRTEVWW